MRALLVTAVLLLVAACATTTNEHPLTGSAQAAPVLVATLSTNACEAITAPVYTAAIVATRQAARAVQAKQLAPDEAQVVADLGSRAKRDLDTACTDPRQPDPARLAAAEHAVEVMQAIVGGAR